MTKLKIINKLSYRYAEAVLNHEDFKASYEEIKTVIANTDVPLLDPGNLTTPRSTRMKRRERPENSGRHLFLPVNQIELNKQIESGFKGIEDSEWICQNRIVNTEYNADLNTKLKGDFKKRRLHVEVQFGNMARWYTDVFKFQLSYALDDIDVAVLIVPMQSFGNLIDENVVYFERIARELPAAKMSLTLPILVVGVGPSDFAPVRQCYEEAAANWIDLKRQEGKAATTIPFERRLGEHSREPNADKI